MKPITYIALKEELQIIKTAEGIGGHLAEIGGLGILAAPTIAKMRGKPMNKKNTNRAEVAGLGTLAAPSAINVAKHFMKRASADLDLANGALSLFTKKAAKSDQPFNSPKPSTSNAGKVRDPKIQPLVGDEADWASRTNLVSIRGGSDSGRVIPTANQMKTAESDLWDPGTGKVIGGATSSRAANRGIGALSKPKPKFTLDHLRNAYQKSGLKPGLGSALQHTATSVMKHASVKLGAPVRLGVGAIGKDMLGGAFRAAHGAGDETAARAAKAVADPRRASMLSHFTPKSQINMKRALPL